MPHIDTYRFIFRHETLQRIHN